MRRSEGAKERYEGGRPCASRRARGLTGAAELYKLSIPNKRGDYHIKYSLFVLFFMNDKFDFLLNIFVIKRPELGRYKAISLIKMKYMVFVHK